MVMAELDQIRLLVLAHLVLANIVVIRYSLHQQNIALAYAISQLPCSASDFQQLASSTSAIISNYTKTLCADTSPSPLMRALIVSPDFANACMLAAGGMHRTSHPDHAVTSS